MLKAKAKSQFFEKSQGSTFFVQDRPDEERLLFLSHLAEAYYKEHKKPMVVVNDSDVLNNQMKNEKIVVINIYSEDKEDNLLTQLLSQADVLILERNMSPSDVNDAFKEYPELREDLIKIVYVRQYLEESLQLAENSYKLLNAYNEDGKFTGFVKIDNSNKAQIIESNAKLLLD